MTAAANVLVIGLGPVGAVAALRLAQAGIGVTIIEASQTIPHDLRASTIHPPTLEMLDEVGLADTLIAQGLKAPVYQYRDRKSHEIFAFNLTEIADRTRYPFRLQCEQHKLAWAAADALAKMPNVIIHYDTSLVDVAQDAEGVTATIRDADGDRTIKAPFLIAADGASSATRQLLDIAFAGFTYPEAFLCLSTLYPIEERLPGLAYVNYVSDPDEWLVLLRAPSAWRVLVPVTETTDSATMLTDAYKQGVFERLLGPEIDVTTLHRTIYRIHQRVADRFVVGRIALAGDAAHVNSPIGGYGMNSGIHDAMNLADTLIAILLRDGTLALLDRYERQRRTTAVEFVQAQTIDNTRALREGWSAARDHKRDGMARLLGDDTARREFLLRQSMFTSLEDAQAIV